MNPPNEEAADMTESQAASVPDQVASIHIEVPIERVWDEITKTGRVQKAVYNSVLETELEPGSRLRYYSADRKRVFVVGEVVEVEPPRKLSYTYLFTMWKDGGPTLVTWELEPEADGTRVTVTHSGFTAAHKDADKQAAGWREILGLLKAELETGSIPLGKRIQYRLMGLLSFMLPASTKPENWD